MMDTINIFRRFAWCDACGEELSACYTYKVEPVAVADGERLKDAKLILVGIRVQHECTHGKVIH